MNNVVFSEKLQSNEYCVTFIVRSQKGFCPNSLRNSSDVNLPLITGLSLLGLIASCCCCLLWWFYRTW